MVSPSNAADRWGSMQAVPKARKVYLKMVKRSEERNQPVVDPLDIYGKNIGHARRTEAMQHDFKVITGTSSRSAVDQFIKSW